MVIASSFITVAEEKAHNFKGLQCQWHTTSSQVLQYVLFFFNPQLLQQRWLQENLNLKSVGLITVKKACENMDRLFHTDSEIGRHTNFLWTAQFFIKMVENNQNSRTGPGKSTYQQQIGDSLVRAITHLILLELIFYLSALFLEADLSTERNK